MLAVSAPRRFRLALTLVVAVALVAALYVAAVRVKKEHAARRVEIAMDYTDFSALAKSYGYDESAFLIALRRAGLTSLAVPEELGAGVGVTSGAILLPGQQVIDTARISTVSDPTLAKLVRSGGIDASKLYLLVYDPAQLPRYREAIELHLGPHAARVIRASGPAILEVRSQIDFFNALGLGLPNAQVALAQSLGLLLIPRVQNDERFGPAEIDRVFASWFRNKNKVSTAIFFGARNEVLGYPDHLDATAAALQKYGVNFGAIETYDKVQEQKGNQGLGTLAIGQTTRVQAIAKAELDKLDFNTVVARYLLGVRERNVRVVYLRPFLHVQGDLSLEKTNVELVREIADGLRERGFKLGRATPVPDFTISPIVIALVSLAVPAIFLLLLEAFGVRRPRIAYLAFALDLALVALGYASHHDLLARKLIALAGAIMFATMSVVAVPRSFTSPAPRTLGLSVLAGLRTVGVATAFALAGALVVVGLLSVPLLMEEIDAFSGVKAVIVVPPVLAFVLYAFTRRFGNEPQGAAQSAMAPVRVYQLVALGALALAAVLYIARSGNQSDIAPSTFELAMRSGLTTVLGVRPRFKEFAIGFPLMMLLPALRLDHRRAIGWLFAVGIAIGAADIVDTFSHLHTPLIVSLLRLLNGMVIGVAIGALAIVVYRALALRPNRAAAGDRATAA